VQKKSVMINLWPGLISGVLCRTTGWQFIFYMQTLSGTKLTHTKQNT